MFDPAAFFKTKRFLLVSGCIALPLAAFLSTGGFGQLPVVAEKTMDPLFCYPPAIIHDYLDAQGQNGRAAYLVLHIVDYFFLLCFYPFLSSLLYRLNRTCTIRGPFSYSFVLPLAAGLFDLTENLFIDLLILLYPARIGLPASIASFSTCAKFSLLYSTFVMLLLFFARWIFSSIRKNKRIAP